MPRSEDETGSVGPEIIITDWLLVCISTLFFGLRIYSKFLHKTYMWWDDHVLIAAWFCLVLDAVVNTINIYLGFGKHIQFAPPQNLKHIDTLIRLSTTAMMLGAAWSKTSFGLTVLRLIRDRPKVKTLVLTIIASMNSFVIFNVIAVWVQCGVGQPDDSDAHSNCSSKEFTVSTMMFAGVYSGLMDVVLAVMPWCLIWKLHMQRKEKIGIGIAMSMGLLLIIWGAAEVATTICAASIPQLRVLFREVVITHHRRHEDNGSRHDDHHLQEYPQQQHHVIREKHPEVTTRNSSFGSEPSSASGSGTGSGSGSGACAGGQQDVEDNNTPSPAPAPESTSTRRVPQPLRPFTTTAVQVTSGPFDGFSPTSTTVAATDNRSNNSSLSSYMGILRGASKSKSKSRKREEQDEQEWELNTYTKGHGYPTHTINSPNQPWKRDMVMGGILQTQEVRVQIHDRDADIDELKIGLAV
ncbi:hypothetical protein B0T20DRAFT_457333 [Sordaria brevicollis]|uniref:Rhodopsin domain-containing protein n=1 Tax=Sordaria brevicollis TaxID=83679 RepID=A0AAE0NVU4_SORBR|nr:hypothetical protein B0T20DRAFT_457333 [Sordaria brevicollis]